MLNLETLHQFTRQFQTSLDNILQEYCQNLFLSYLYQEAGSERLLFKGGTALRMIFKSPRFSEDLDFTGIHITQSEIDELFMNTLANIEKTGVHVEIQEAKKTTGGYLGIAVFKLHEREAHIQIEISLRNGKKSRARPSHSEAKPIMPSRGWATSSGSRALIQNSYLPAYTIVHEPLEELVTGKLNALLNRQKPRDFYDFYFFLSGDFPLVREKSYLTKVFTLLRESKINFRNELRRLLPMSHAMLLKDFKKILEQKIQRFLP